MISIMVILLVGGAFMFAHKNVRFTQGNIGRFIEYARYKGRYVFLSESLAQEQNAKAESIPVLLYHSIILEPTGENVTKENFEEQMFLLKEAGWQTISMQDYLDYMHNKKTLPDRSFLLTFDDGAKDSYYPVDPLLKALGFRATSFIISKYSLTERQNGYYLSLPELRSMRDSGRWDIEAHTHAGHDVVIQHLTGEETHFYSSLLWTDNETRRETMNEFQARVTGDLGAVKNGLESSLGIQTESFAFPFGDFGQHNKSFPELKNILLAEVQKKFHAAFYQTWPGNGYTQNYPSPETFLMKRIVVRPSWDAETLLWMLEAGHVKSLPYDDEFITNHGWIEDWGTAAVTIEGLSISADEKTNGGSAYLDGTYTWHDYRVDSEVDWVRGEAVSVVARYQKDSDFLACTYTENFVVLDQTVGGKKERLAESKLATPLRKGKNSFGASVQGDSIACFVENQTVLTYEGFDGARSQGGIGFRVWSSKAGESRVIVTRVAVTPQNP